MGFKLGLSQARTLMLDYIDNFTIQSIILINFFILFFWLCYVSTQYIAKILRSIFNLRNKRYDE